VNSALAIPDPAGNDAPAAFVHPDGSISPVATEDDGTAPCCCGGGRWFIYAPCSGSGPRMFVPENAAIGSTFFVEMGGFQSVDTCFVKQVGPGIGPNNQGTISEEYFEGDPEPGALVYPTAGTLADPLAIVIVLDNQLCNPGYPWPWCGTPIYRLFFACDGLFPDLSITVDIQTRDSLNQITCIYNGRRYRIDPGISFGTPVPVIWSTEPCGGNENSIARLCSDPTVTITYDRRTRPSIAHITMLYAGERYFATDEESADPAVTVVWSTDECEPIPGSDFYIATRCRNTGSALDDPAEVVVAVVPSIGPGNGRVFRTTIVPNPRCPGSGSFCVRRTEYQLTLTPATGPATPRVSHVQGTPCGQDALTCQTCPGDPAEPPIIVPGGPAGFSSDDQLDAMGLTPKMAAQMASDPGCCGPPA